MFPWAQGTDSTGFGLAQGIVMEGSQNAFHQPTEPECTQTLPHTTATGTCSDQRCCLDTGCPLTAWRGRGVTESEPKVTLTFYASDLALQNKNDNHRSDHGGGQKGGC